MGRFVGRDAGRGGIRGSAPLAPLCGADVARAAAAAAAARACHRPAPTPAATGHHADGAPLRGGWRIQPELAGAGLWTTPADLTRLGVEVHLAAAAGRSELLSRDLAVRMVTPQVPGGYGLGTQVDDHGGRPRFGRGGGNTGFCCRLQTWPDTGTGVAVMLNDELVVADGTVTMPGQPPLPLEPLGGNRFRVAGPAGEPAFTGDGLEVRQEGVTQTATRLPGTAG